MTMARHCTGCSHPTICRTHGCAAVEARNNKERAAIAKIPPALLADLAKAQAAYRAGGGCKGCGSLVLAVHQAGCPTSAADLY